jgi:hypothetical protein
MRRTISDWLSHARAAGDPLEVERCLDQAVAEAASCHEWRLLLEGIAELQLSSRARLTEAANRTLERAMAEREVWGFRDVAKIRATRLDDAAGARAALEAGAALLRQPRSDILGRAAELLGKVELARGYEWVLLGQGFSETLCDDDGMRRCLEIGRDVARAQDNADDLCAIATEWAERVDRAEGAALLLEAEAMASNGSARPWTLANAWRALGDSEAAQRVLGAALRGATSSEAALHVASAWASHHQLDEARRAVPRAEELATTARDWLEIAESTFDAGLGEAPIRRALERAQGLATDADTRGRVSSAYKQWLDDEVAATRAGPRGLRPDALRRRVTTLSGWETSAAGLFDWLRARVTAEALRKIAGADYGMDADKHEAALRDMCESGLVPRKLAWEPHEVLALTRWASGEAVNHLERALSCTLLCLAPSDFDELVTNGPILAESCMALGAEASRQAELFFGWRAETEPDAEAGADPEQPIALLLLFLMRAASAPDDPRLEALAAMLVEHPHHALEEVAEWMTESMRAQLWSDLIERILVPLEATHPPTRRVLRALGR